MSTTDTEDPQELRARIAELEGMIAQHAMLGPLLESIPAVVMRIALDARIEFINRVLPEYAGAPLVGKTIYDFAPPDQHERMRAAFELAVRERTASRFESIAEAPDGTRDWYSSTFAPILAGDELVSLVLISVNVSRARANELALRDREARLRLALDAGNIGTWRWDVAADDVVWDDKLCSIFGVTQAEAPKTRAAFLAMVSEEQRPLLDAHITRAVETGDYPDFELSADQPGGRRWFVIKGGTLRDTTGRVTALIGGVLDDTERRRLELAVAQAQKLEAVGRLAAGVAHNFNNVLTSIVLALELARDRLPAPDSEQMADTLSAALHAAGLVRDMMAFSRGRTVSPAPREPLDRVLRRAVELSHKTLDRRIQVAISGLDAPSLAGVHVNAEVVEQMIVNLMMNARDALDGVSGDRARIDVSTHRVRAEQIARVHPDAKGEYAVIVVRDRGLGMDEETRRRCFDPFFTTKEIGKGTGLGLSTTWAAIRGEGGFLDCDSTPGVGTTFTVYLPAAPPATAAPSVAREAAVPTGAGRRVLVVDDEPLVRRSCIALLASEGYEARGAASGEEAIALARAERMDAVLLDHSMPGLTPAETLRRLREIDPTLPILTHSGLDVTLEGASGHVAKPARGQAIAEAIAAAIASAAATRDAR
jgi:two-component system cell cycle sensor histidine kinase/response regulator CckA